MASPFAITAASTTIQLSDARQGEAVFTVSNTSGQPLEGRATITPNDPATAGWFQMVGDVERAFEPDETHQYNVQITVPPDTAPGSYSFHLDIVGVENPDDQYSRGPTVQVQVPAAAKEPAAAPFPWWIVAVVVGVLLVGGGLMAYLIWGRDDTNGPVAEATATPTPPPDATVTPTALPPEGQPVTITFDDTGIGVVSANTFAGQGIQFTTTVSNFGDEVVGIVENGSTSACVEAKSRENHVLATGRGNNRVGMSAFPIQITFDPPVREVSAEYQGPSSFRMSVFSNNTNVLTVRDHRGSPSGTCGFPGSERSIGRITAREDAVGSPITSVILAPSNGTVFAIDNLRFLPLD
jgi:hypothetical protein